MANEIITTLHPDQDPDTNLYPNIKKENIPSGSIDRNKLDGEINNLLDEAHELHIDGVDTSTNILAFTEDKGIYVGSDTGYWYYWNGTQYVSGGTFISSVTPSLQTGYITNNASFYYAISGANALIYVYGNIAVVINNTIRYVDQATINTDYPSETSISNGILTITLAGGKSLVFNKVNNKVEIVTTITNDMIVLIRNGSGQLLGGALYYKIVNNELDILYKERITQFYSINDYCPIIEENYVNLGKCYFKFSGQFAIRVGLSSTYTMSTLATELGVTLVTSPSGITDCLEISNEYNFVFNCISNKFEIVSRTNVKKYHIIMIGVVNGRVIDGIFNVYVNRIKNAYVDRMQLYITEGNYPYIENDLKNKKIYFSFGQIANRLSFTSDKTHTPSSLATELGVTLTTSTEGFTNCIEIPNEYSLVFNIANSKYRLVPRASVVFTDIILIANISGCNIKGVFVSYKNEFVNNNDYNNRIPLKNKATELETYINDSEETDLYLFFTDPHTQPNSFSYEALLGYIAKYDKTIPFDFVLCGGDWLQNSDSPSQAKYRLGYITQSYNSNCLNYHQLIGNHDTNYQGTEILDNQTLVNVYNRKENSNYYSFKTNNTTYYCLDTGTDWVTTMDSYRWDQINWLANKLLNEDVKHSVIALHIYWNSGTTLSDMATNLNSLIIAYNTKTSVTLNGVTYDFTNYTGHIEYVISGHTHADMNDTIGTIPVFSSINAIASGVLCFDMIYADYDNRTLSLIRVGTGDNRQFDLDTGNLIE